MSPVHSLSAPSFRTQRRRASPTTAGLFPECPDVISPMQVVHDFMTGGGKSADAPVADQLTGDRNTVGRGSDSNQTTADCPPASRTQHGTQNRERGPVRNDAAAPPERAHARLVGIARLAAFSPPAETRRKSEERPEYFVLPVKSILNRCDSKRVPFEWTINPYRGCEFACKYCYAPERSGGTEAEHIAIGTATDPYQPAEREYGVTRACLEELAKREGLSVSLITKSNQIVRDIDVLKRIADRSDLAIDITITTLRPRLARLLEPRAPRPDLRLTAVKHLREAGLAVGVSASPLIPGITDRDGDLEAVAEAAKEAGAQWFFSGVLFLMPSSAKQFLPFVREKFPRLAKQYEHWYRKNGYAPEEYRRKASERVARIRQRYGFKSRPWVEKKHTTPCAQLPLAWDAGAVAQQVDHPRSCAAR